MHGEEKRFRILLSSEPIYETSKDAEQAGQTTIDAIKGMDLSAQIEELKAQLCTVRSVTSLQVQEVRHQ